jgi:hypothetical protein
MTTNRVSRKLASLDQTTLAKITQIVSGEPLDVQAFNICCAFSPNPSSSTREKYNPG